MNGEAYQVQWIERGSVGLIKKEGTEEEGSIHLTAVPLSFISPIPLTPEILEKNGWSRKKNYGWYLFNDKYIRINIWFDKDRWDVEVCSEDGRVTYANITGRGTLHTHQLQHALRLAGIEKEIEV
jgi:hypothetical protein